MSNVQFSDFRFQRQREMRMPNRAGLGRRRSNRCGKLKIGRIGDRAAIRVESSQNSERSDTRPPISRDEDGWYEMDYRDWIEVVVEVGRSVLYKG